MSTSITVLAITLFLMNCFYGLRSDRHHHHDPHHCDQYSSSCGGDGGGNTLNIIYPFRFQGDPENCGNKKYELPCENNHPIFQFSSGAKYYVLAFNYNNYTIRLVDVGIQNGNCSSLPLYPLSNGNL
ncbi:hypothetical protein LOK49_LG11G00076 [Camellia lanceoleosa]|uniref:Uncharacterized protein n=1 Tax=Camellia lanceoleosa TaxID=1840588 RepID=A0ACC0G4S1_9ERIC|nr:hypothetical protein LOK49_LG11G00076 [Camellia lanceoleosa]